MQVWLPQATYSFKPKPVLYVSVNSQFFCEEYIIAAKKKATKKKAKAKKKASPAVKKPPTKSEIMSSIAETTELSRKEVASVFEALEGIIQDNLKPRGPGMFSIPGLMKIRVIKKPATKARKGINPFTKEETIFKAKPARKVVKVLPLKGLKDMV